MRDQIYQYYLECESWTKQISQLKLFTQNLNDFFYLSINLLLNLTSMRNLSRKQSTQSQENQVNYKQLYLQCKNNVAIFMKHVDTEVSSILKKHESEKKMLEAQIERLKGELRQRNQNSALQYSKNSMKSSHKRSNSQSYVNTQASVTSVSRQAVEECLSKLNNFDFQPKYSLTKKTHQESRIQTTMKSVVEEQKENHLTSVNYTQQIDLGELKVLNTSSRRDKTIKQKKIQQSAVKAQNIKDFLKDIRGRLSSREKSSSLKQKEEPIISIITPELFSSTKMKNC